MPIEVTYAFGPFLLDVARRRLLRENEPVVLPDRHVDILHTLVARAGEIVAKDDLIAIGWKDVAVTDNSLEQAVSSLRRRLGQTSDDAPYIETLARRGYRFRGPVTRGVPRQTDDVLASLLLPYRTFVEGRAAIETLGREAVDRARAAFASVVATQEDYAPGHIGLANALALHFDATRGGETVDVEALRQAMHHAREACRLDVDSGEAWATLAFVLSRPGASLDAVAAGRRATALEPDNWRHYVRLAYAAWGDERLRAARVAARLLPGFGLAHWLAATVHVARQALDDAAREVVAGAAAQDVQPESGRFASVGLHLLLGLLLVARGEDNGEDELMRELAFEGAGHVYSTQACAGAWCAIGALRLRQGRVPEALEAFDATLARVPGYAPALAAMSAVTTGRRRASMQARLRQRIALLEAAGAGVDASVARAVIDAIGGRHAEAARQVRAALDAAPPGSSAGWSIPIEPLLGVPDHPLEWAGVLAALRARAA